MARQAKAKLPGIEAESRARRLPDPRKETLHAQTRIFYDNLVLIFAIENTAEGLTQASSMLAATTTA